MNKRERELVKSQTPLPRNARFTATDASIARQLPTLSRIYEPPDNGSSFYTFPGELGRGVAVQ